jgi:hypothetical protein
VHRDFTSTFLENGLPCQHDTQLVKKYSHKSGTQIFTSMFRLRRTSDRMLSQSLAVANMSNCDALCDTF